MNHSITFKINGVPAWERTCESGQYGGRSERSKLILGNTVAALSEALTQAVAELSLLLQEGNAVTNFRFVSLADIERDIPVTDVGQREDYRKLSIKSTSVGEGFTALKISEFGISGDHHVTLGVAIDTNGVSGVKVLPRVDELHDGILISLSNQVDSTKSK